MFCTECGAKVSDGAKFCPVCGCKLNANDDRAEDKKDESKLVSLTKKSYKYAKDVLTGGKSKGPQLVAPGESIKAVKVMKAIAPFGFLGGIFILIASVLMILGASGMTGSAGAGLVAVGSYINFGSFAFGLVAAGLLTAYAIMTLIKIRKNNLRTNLAGGIFVALLALMLLTFVVVLLINSITNISLASSWIPGSSTIALVGQGPAGMLFVMLFLSAEIALTYKFNKSATRTLNIKMYRGCAMNSGVSAIVLFVIVLFIMITGFSGSGDMLSTAWLSYLSAASFLNAATATLSFLFLVMIAFAVMEFLDNKPVMKKQIIKWAVIGGVTLIFFIIGICCTPLSVGGPIVAFINWSCALACGIVGMINAKNVVNL